MRSTEQAGVSASRPTSSSTVPFQRDPDFVDRGDLLSRVDERCSQPAGRAALVGLGGVGKSQLAIEYTYRTRDRSLDTWVFWVHASNATRFEQGYRDIAHMVRIAGRDDPKADIFKLVHDWLREHKGKWLMILDNVDDAGFLIDSQPVEQSQSSDSSRQVLRPLREYLPQSQNGSILITTRSRESALKLVEQNGIVMVDPMDKADAFELLDKKLEPTVQRNDEDNTRLVAALERMPLAIVQATAYISQMAPRCSVRQYIEEFQKSDRRKSSLLNHEGGQLRRDGEAKNSIIITWQLSFEHIRQARPSAADLLSLMSFFDPRGIPEGLVRTRSEDGRQADGNRDGGAEDDDDDSQSESSEDDRFEADVQTLRNFSFLTLGANPTVFEMHKLVQLATRKWLEASEQFERWKQQYVSNLYIEVPTGSYENWAKCATLFPHVQSAISQRPKDRDSLLQWASILFNGACALEMSTKAMKTRETLLGQEDEATLSSMDMVGTVYNLVGRWKEAEKLRLKHSQPSVDVSESRAMESGRRARGAKTQKKVFDDGHPSTLASMTNLASMYGDQGRWKEAEELQLQVIETQKRVLSDDHPDTLISICNLAHTFKGLGKYDDAIVLMQECYEKQKGIIGPDHPDTKTSEEALNRWRMEHLRLDAST
ncbi:putative kinesin [Rhizodiscina lignyota]|uniref:Kinesin n=1 Tax=Rhizodiscina lignyota TaxID=1504668 RepID=A0A9P4M8F1_9PEZI|nr:putative kinesin [Rhizodiscina lignyota]